jgi:uncharacterized phage protein gp47/JayE
MLNLIENFNLDSTTGDDLTERALEHGMARLTPTVASGYVSFANTAITKRHSVLYAASPSPAEGAVTLDVERNDDVDLFPAAGYVWIGRGSLNCEKVQYYSITTYSDYVTLNLTLGTLNAHGIESTVVLSQSGSAQTIPIGTEVYVPATDLSAKISFVTKESADILDGESEVTDVLVACSVAGSSGNVTIGAISGITSPPIATITVSNDTSFVNAEDDESDQELRDRIRSTIQSLSRGTKEAILSRIARISSAADHKSVVSSSYVEATELDKPSYVYIDDGTGFEPSWSGQGYEDVIVEAAGTEKFLSLDVFPIMKASLVTANGEPYALIAGSSLTVWVGDVSETRNIQSVAFKNISTATAEEVAAHLNDIFSSIEARTTDTGSKVIISPIATTNDHIKVTGTGANLVLGFPTNQYRYDLNLYKNDILLSKDGSTAFVTTVCPNPNNKFVLADSDVLEYTLDGKAQVLQVVFYTADFVDIANATATEVAAAINAEGVGIQAVVTSDEEVKISCIGDPSSSSRLTINACTAAAPLGLTPATSTYGWAKDYTLNRYNGQIELATALVALDTITAGSNNTRAFLRCQSPGPYSMAVGPESIDISIDGGAVVTWTSTLGAGSFSAAQIAADINADAGIAGATAFVKTINMEDYLCIRTNTQDSATGSIEIDATSAPSLDFANSVVVANQEPSMGYAESAVTPFTTGRDQNLVVILDSDSINRTWNLPLQSSGTITAATTEISFTDSNLDAVWPVADVLIDFEIQFDANTLTEDLRNEKATIDSYDGAGLITVSAGTAFPVVPVIGDTFKIYPRTAKNVVDLLNNTAFTSLSGFADIEVAKASALGTTDVIQITAKTYGEAGAVQVSGGTANSFSIPFASNGTALGTFTVNTITGLSEGLCPYLHDSTPTNNDTSYIKSITGAAAPYTIAMRTITAPDISAYLVADAATIVSPAIPFATNGLNVGTFTTASIVGLTLGMAIQIDSGAEPAFNCYIRHIVGAGPYTITVEVAPDLSAFTTSAAALIKDNYGLAFSTINNVGIDAYKYLTGLAQEVQWQIDGLDSDPENYPGIKAAGTQLEVKAPVIKLIDFEIDITPSVGYSVNDVANDIRSAVSSYVNRSGVGADIVLSEVIAAIHQVSFVDDVSIVSPTANITISDTELPRTNEVMIALG